MGSTLKDGMHAASEKLEDALDSAKRKAEDLQEVVSDFSYDALRLVKRHPGKTIAISLATGFLLGAFLCRRRD